MEPIYRCSGCGEWFTHITVIGDYTPGDFGPLQFCENDLRQLAIDLEMEL